MKHQSEYFCNKCGFSVTFDSWYAYRGFCEQCDTRTRIISSVMPSLRSTFERMERDRDLIVVKNA